MLKKIIITGLLLIGFSISTFSQEKGHKVIVNNVSDTDATLPSNIDQDLEEQLTLWAKNMRLSENCNYDDSGTVTYPDSVYIERLYALPTTMELSFNPVVRKFIEMYAGRRKQVSYMLGEGEFYFPLFEKALDKENMPLELKYLPVIESALNPIARSRVGATGLWQFMLGTGKLYDLEINSLVDERSDPHKSTEAAVKYMKALYGLYGDWNLVIAAYNCGPGNVSKAIRRAGGLNDYWAIYPYLPRETRSYVPIFIAATYIMNYYKEHDICPAQTALPVLMDSVVVNKNVHFQQIADMLNIPIEDIRIYNPQFKRDIVPGAYKPYAINLPLTKATAFIDKQDAIFKYKADELLTHRKVVEIQTVGVSGGGKTYKVKKGDTLSGIAQKHGISVNSLKRWNNLKSNNIPVNKSLYVSNPTAVIPKKKETDIKIAETVTPTTEMSDENPALVRTIVTTKSEMVTSYHKVKKGETLTSIAKDYDVSTSEIRAWNNMKTNKITIGSNLKIKKVELKEVTDTVHIEEPLLTSLCVDSAYIGEVLTEYADLVGKSDIADLPRIKLGDDDEAEDQNDRFGNAPDRIIYHKVRIGETLPKIADRYNVTREDIIKWNNLSSNVARIGQRLMIQLPDADINQ